MKKLWFIPILLLLLYGVSHAGSVSHGKRSKQRPKIIKTIYDGQCVGYLFTAIEDDGGGRSQWTLSIEITKPGSHKVAGATVHRRLPRGRSADGMKGEICYNSIPKDRNFRAYKINAVLKKNHNIVDKQCQWHGGKYCR